MNRRSGCRPGGRLRSVTSDDGWRPDAERVGEYLQSLQSQLDRAQDRNARLEARIDRLVSDRDRLRQRLARSRPLRARLKRQGTSAATPTPTPAVSEPAGIDIPGVGLITDDPLPAVPPSRPLEVATVLDPFSKAAFQYEFQCIDVTATDWRSTLEHQDPALLLVESVFAGPGGSWAGQVARFGDPGRSLEALVEWFRLRGRPTVFWNKEDPINFDWFVASAHLFDHVFTVDADSIPLYRRTLGHDRIHLMQFAAQPAIHRPPVSETERTGSTAFAGTYYAAKHPERREQMESVIGGAVPFDLHIFDRDHGGDARFEWPPRFRSHIIGSLTYSQTLEAYRRYKVFLNINTVTDSSTMCARRIFELLASGTAVVSGPSRAIDAMIPAGIVEVVSDEPSAAAAIRSLLEDPTERQSRALRGRAWIDQGHTMSHRVDRLLETVL